MKQLIVKLAKKVAPQAVENFAFVSQARTNGDDVMELLKAYELEVHELKRELNEMRRDQRRMAELYDLVFERVRSDSPGGTRVDIGQPPIG